LPNLLAGPVPNTTQNRVLFVQGKATSTQHEKRISSVSYGIPFLNVNILV